MATGNAGLGKRSAAMEKRFEYRFERVGEGWLGLKRFALTEYREIIERRAREGWRLVQVFAPGTGVYGHAGFFEMIFERPME